MLPGGSNEMIVPSGLHETMSHIARILVPSSDEPAGIDADDVCLCATWGIERGDRTLLIAKKAMKRAVCSGVEPCDGSEIVDVEGPRIDALRGIERGNKSKPSFAHKAVDLRVRAHEVSRNHVAIVDGVGISVEAPRYTERNERSGAILGRYPPAAP